MNRRNNARIGGRFSDFLAELGAYAETTRAAREEVAAWQVARQSASGRRPVVSMVSANRSRLLRRGRASKLV